MQCVGLTTAQCSRNNQSHGILTWKIDLRVGQHRLPWHYLLTSQAQHTEGPVRL